MQQILEYCPSLLLKGSLNDTISKYYYDRLNHFQLFKYGCENGDTQTIEYLIENDGTTIAKENYFELTCEMGDVQNVKLMIEKGARDWDRGLEGACLGGHLDLTELMIEKGATIGNGDFGMHVKVDTWTLLDL